MKEITETMENVVFDIYQMKLHEFYAFSEINALVLRVPGGWIYSYLYQSSLVFVPYNDEFAPEMKMPNF